MYLSNFYNRVSYSLETPPKFSAMRWKAMLAWHRNRCAEGLTPAVYLSMMAEFAEISYLNYIGEDT